MIHFLKKIALLCSLGMTSAYAASSLEPVFDEFTRLIEYPGKIETVCPKQDKNTAVLLVIGQSNSANHAAQKISTAYPNRVFNYFNGKCYVATSPLLGATGARGEFITPLADELIANGIYQKVVIVSSGINGTAIALWTPGGALHNMLKHVLEDVRSRYAITEVIWHQGETDFIHKTPKEEYKKSFYALLNTLRTPNSNTPPLYYAIATLCGYWYPNNPIAEIQHTFASEADNIFQGPDTDTLIPITERQDTCHLTYIGQLKAAHGFAEAIAQNKMFYSGK
ncbi:MAG: sialate O-acetylesterase [Tatlockia sp.]|jgi:hypothetical protein